MSGAVGLALVAKEPATETVLNPVAKQVAQLYRRDKFSPVMLGGIMQLAETALLAVMGFLLYVAYVGHEPALVWNYLGVSTAAAVFAVLMLDFAEAYEVPTLLSSRRALRPVLIVWSATFALMATAAFFTRMSNEFSRVWYVSWFFLGFVAIIAVRYVVARLARRWVRNGRMERRAIIVGGGKRAEGLIRALEQQPANDIRICGIFDDRDDKRSPSLVAGHPKLGTISELIEFGRIARIDMLIVSLPLTAENRVKSLLKDLWVLPVDIRLSAHASDLSFRPRTYSYIGNVPMLDVYDRPISNWDSVAKRCFDIAFGLLALVLVAPVMLVTALAIKLDSKGPVFFRQKRHGFNNEIIDVYKFRSMYTDRLDPSGRNAVRRQDPRVTRVGRIIRKTSIDELPQLFNVLRGNLSLVGPRPHVMSAVARDMLYHEVVEGYFARHRVKPGVTGWAQINGWRGETDTVDKIRQRTEHDLYYIENWSIWFDLKILLLTPFSLFNTENAY
ncbi:MAG: undecaprenyl-phosphate glucose phosphotransferase [Rhizobiaceae bacterium]|nr:undecaprenyl-phosphate glucose phosphotransferase [Rhizobiaceae bacterium]